MKKRSEYLIILPIIILFLIPSTLAQNSLPSCEPPFTEGDTNNDGSINIADAILILNWLFASGEPPHCFETANVNGDKLTNLADPIYLLNYLFTGGEPPITVKIESPSLLFEVILTEEALSNLENLEFEEIPSYTARILPTTITVIDIGTKGEIFDCKADRTDLETNNKVHFFKTNWEGHRNPYEDILIVLTQDDFEKGKEYLIKVDCWNAEGKHDDVEAYVNILEEDENTNTNPENNDPWCFYGETWTDVCCKGSTGYYCVYDSDGPDTQAPNPECRNQNDLRDFKECCPDYNPENPQESSCFKEDSERLLSSSTNKVEFLPLQEVSSKCEVESMAILRESDLEIPRGTDMIIPNQDLSIRYPDDTISKKTYGGSGGHVEGWKGFANPYTKKANVYYMAGYAFYIHAILKKDSDPDICPEHQFVQVRITQVTKDSDEEMIISDQILNPQYMHSRNEILKTKKLQNMNLASRAYLSQNTRKYNVEGSEQVCEYGTDQYCDDNYNEVVDYSLIIKGVGGIRKVPKYDKRHQNAGDTKTITWYDSPGMGSGADYIENINKNSNLAPWEQDSGAFKKAKKYEASFISIVEDSSGEKRWICELNDLVIKNAEKLAISTKKAIIEEPSCYCYQQAWSDTITKWEQVPGTRKSC